MKNFSLQLSTPFSRRMGFGLLMLLCAARLPGQYDLLSQEPEILSFNEWAHAISDDGQGNTCLAGVFQNSITLGSITLTTVPTPPGDGWPSTAFIGKFNSNSNSWLWAKTIALVVGSGQNTYKRSVILDMTLDNSGNIYITGEYAGTVLFDNIQLTSTKQGSVPTNDIFVAKLNSSGVFTWAKSLGSKAGWDSGRSIVLDGTNNIYVGGFFTNKVASCSGSNVEQKDVYLAKLNNAGTSLWQKRYASNVAPCGCTGCNITNNSGYDVAVDGSGNVYLTGTYYATMSFGNGPGMSITSVNGTNDVFAAKINGSGTTQWVKSAGGSTLDYGRAIYTDVAGNVYAGGFMGANAFTSKYSATGALLWSVNPFPLSTAFPSSDVKCILPYDNSLLVYDLYIGFKTLSMTDGAVITSDSLVGNGDYNNEAPGHFSIRDAEIAGSGYVFNLDGLCGTVVLDNLTLTSSCVCGSSCAGRDILMVRTSASPPLAAPPVENATVQIIASHDMPKSDFTFYPNPTTGVLNIDLPTSDEEVRVTIQNHFGKIIWTGIADPDHRSMTINLDNRYSEGIYYISYCTSRETVTKPLIVAR